MTQGEETSFLLALDHAYAKFLTACAECQAGLNPFVEIPLMCDYHQ